MIKSQSFGHRRSFIASLILHVVLAKLIFSSITSSKINLNNEDEITKIQRQNVVHDPKVVTSSIDNQVSARSVSSKDLNDELVALNHLENSYQREHQNKVKSLEREYESIKKKKDQDLNQLKSQADQLKSKRDQLAKEVHKDQELKSKLNTQIQQVQNQMTRLEKLADLKKELLEETLSSDENLLKSYRAKVSYHMGQYWKVPLNTAQKLRCIIDVEIIPNGIVRGAQLKQSSGSKAFDEAAIAAIYKASPLPFLEELRPEQRPKKLTMTFVPDHIAAG